MSTNHIIEFAGLDVYQDDNLVLSDVNLNVSKGEFLYLIGKVGSGKTSLIKIINAELDAKKATKAEVAGFNLLTLKSNQIPLLRRTLGVVFQDFKLLPDRSVHDNLQFVLKATSWKDKVKIERRIKDVLEMVDLFTKAYKKPHQLSGGEQQRVAIARALLNNPQLIVADEPTGNLDPETSETIMRLLFDINKVAGITIVMATHNHGLIKKFPTMTIKCENGSICEVAANAEIELDIE
ncbi:MAG: ATP-binding cassette domain-containing protein [Prevotellaceae bacterium]|jgi:cell division transport system ATP-binding protein|nr:ATP-binding cassette domain-containing protein [Prevotellaceae bacterium]